MGVVFGLDYYGVFKVNLDKKLELAHEYAVEILKTTHANHGFLSEIEIENITETSWALSDAMEAEYNKRKQAEAEKNAKQSEILFEQLTKNKDGSCAHFHTTFNKTECFDCGSKLDDEFQVDWSVAPDDAMEWRMFGDGSCVYYASNGGVLCSAPSFNYQGDWKDSLRKRP